MKHAHTDLMDFYQVSSIHLGSSLSNVVNKNLTTAYRNFGGKIFKSVNETTAEKFLNLIFIVDAFFLIFFLARFPIAMTDQQLSYQANF